MADHSVSHGQVFAFLWRYLKGHLGALTVMVFMLLVSTGLTLAQPFFYKNAVDIIAGGTPGDRSAFTAAVKMVLFGVGCGIGALSLHELSSYLLGIIQSKFIVDVHSHVFAKVQRLSTQFHVNSFAGAISRKIGRGVDGLETMTDRLWFNFLPLFAFTLGLIGVLAWFAPLLGIVMVTSMVMYLCISVSLNLFMTRYFEWKDKQDTLVTASLVDALTGNALVKAFGAEDREHERHNGVLSEWGYRTKVAWRVVNITSWIQFMLLMLIELLVFLLTIFLWYRGEISAGSFIVVMFYIGQLWGRLFDIGSQIRQYLQGKSYGVEMVALANEHVGVDDKENAKPLDVSKGAIAFDSVTFRYENKPDAVFEHFSVSIKPGEKIALAGHSGGGKSSFVKLLLRLYEIESGSITVDQQNINDVTQQSLRRNIALVPQDPILFHRSIAENMSYAKPGATKEEIEHAAKLAHAHEFIAKLPNGYDTLVGERGVKLSGGERQRVAIARAILADAPILILDEATSSLDSQSEAYIQEALEYLMKGRTTIVIAHRLSTIKQVDRIFVIEDGKIAEEGSHCELVQRDGGVYRGFFEQQAGGFIGE